MQGVTTALVAFIFFCVVFPERVKNRPQFYAALGLICGIIILDALGYSIGGKFAVLVYFADAFMQVGAILLLFLAAGGITWRELGSDMAHAFEVIRRGGEEKEVIIPLTGQQPRPREPSEAPAERIPIDEPSPPAPNADKGVSPE
jgi:hypothetical protein